MEGIEMRGEFINFKEKRRAEREAVFIYRKQTLATHNRPSAVTPREILKVLRYDEH